MKNTMKDLPSLLESLSAEIRAVDEMEGVVSPPAKRRQFPPAKDPDLAAYEKRWGFALPPSYVEFLRIHNGWEGINAGDLSVIGVSGPGYAPARKEFDRYSGVIEKEYKRKGKDYAAQLQKRESSDSKVIYLPNHIPIALDYNGTYWVFDKNRPTRNGEYSIAVVKGGEEVIARFENSYQFLQAVANSVSKQLPVSKRSTGSHRATPKQRAAASPKKAPSNKGAKSVRKR
jgi:cell wall assembly regulator SMI1